MELDKFWKQIRLILKSHPWHGVPVGINYPREVNAYIEIVPTDTVKYEIEKNSGYLQVDRPQKFSSLCPTPYGFIPQTYCGRRIAEYCMKRSGLEGIKGDGDPIDICVLSEKVISHSDILLHAIPIGGLRMIDGNEADDKIIAVMKNDSIYGEWRDITDCPDSLIQRLKHYFLSYKDVPGEVNRNCMITHVYDCKESFEIIEASHEDYLESYSDLAALLKTTHERNTI